MRGEVTVGNTLYNVTCLSVYVTEVRVTRSGAAALSEVRLHSAVHVISWIKHFHFSLYTHDKQ